MKQTFILLVSGFFILFITSALKAQKTTVEEVKKICEGLDKSQMPMVAVMPFKIAAPGVDNAVGTGLPEMLSNAILNAGCFRVVNRDRLNEIMKEQGLTLEGGVDENSGAQVGKIAGAQVLVFGTVTKFKEDESGGNGGGGLLKKGGLLGKIGGLAGKVKSTTSLLGYTLQFVDANTAEVLDSKSFDEKVTSSGLAGGGMGANANGIGVAGGGFYQHKSMEDAIEKSLIEAVQYMSQNKSAYTDLGKSSQSASKNTQSKTPPANCPILKATKKPAIVVIIPEEHISGEGSNYDPYRNSINIHFNYERDGIDGYVLTPPCESAETAISSELTESGFDLKDATQLEELKKENSFKNAYKSSSDASKIGSRFGVDMIIVGQAFSEYSKKGGGLVSCRATLSVKAIMRSDASIIATKSFKGSGLDASEIIAGKVALEKAGTQMADYLQQQFCLKDNEIISSMSMKEEGPAADNAEASNNTNTKQSNSDNDNVSRKQTQDIDMSERKARDVSVTINGISYDETKSLSAAIEKMKGVNSVTSPGFAMGQVSYKVNTLLTYDELIESVKKWNPKLKYTIQAATDQYVMMIVSDEK